MASLHYGRPEPPVFKRNGFELRDQTFTVSGYERFDSQSLKEILNPQPNKINPLGKRVFFAAQLKHYGIDFRPSSVFAEIRNLLEESIRQGKCEQVSDSTIEVQRNMKRDYEPQRQKWANEFRAWDESNKARCDTPQKRAEYDFDWFLRHHYLTDGGEPDHTKTPEALVLQGFNDKRDLIARIVPGLHTALCRPRSESREALDLCVGWDEASVARKAQNINKEVEEERQRKEEEEKKKLDAQWQKALLPHQRYMYRRRAVEVAPPPSFEPRYCVGSYIVRCDENAKKEYLPSGLRLHICPGVDGSLIASYDFGVIEGTMLLDASTEKLDDLVVRLDEKRNRRKCHKHEDCWEDDDDEEDDDDDEEEEEDEQRPTSNAVGSKRAAPDDNTASDTTLPASKRQKTTLSPSTVRFRMRGREAGDDMVSRSPEYFSDPSRGVLRFADDCTTFVGVIAHNAYVGTRVQFVGYKVADKPQQTPDPWKAFSERQAAIAELGEWGEKWL